MPSKVDMKTFVISLLNTRLPAFYYYHNCSHSLDVLNNVIKIGRAEDCTEEQIDLLSTAALWHDTGYIKTYAGHEEESCTMARQYLPSYHYSPENIGKVCGMIMATKIPQSPRNKLEEIIADADLQYLGTAAWRTRSDDLFEELRCLDPSLTKVAWNQKQISFLGEHHYFTRFCKTNNERIKQENLGQLLRGDT